MDNSFHDLEMDVKINSFFRCFIMAMQLYVISIDGEKDFFCNVRFISLHVH